MRLPEEEKLNNVPLINEATAPAATHFMKTKIKRITDSPDAAAAFFFVGDTAVFGAQNTHQTMFTAIRRIDPVRAAGGAGYQAIQAEPFWLKRAKVPPRLIDILVAGARLLVEFIDSAETECYVGRAPTRHTANTEKALPCGR